MNGIICINKPQDWTSFDVVNALSKKYRIKVGHTGTLDPKATGVLVCLVGATKVLPYLDMSTKRYTATCKLGIKTDTGDVWGNIIESSDSVHQIDNNQLKIILEGFIGKSVQQVPMTSAKKVKGKKLYEYQRENIKIEPIYQEIEIIEIELLSISDTEFTFSALVSSGTYMRTLCEDIASKLGTIGTMSQLVRTHCGQFNLDDCVSIDDALGRLTLIPIDEGLTHYPQIEIDEPLIVYSGKRIKEQFVGDQVLVTHKGKALAIYRYDKDLKEYKSQRGLWT